jgi:hypothetical protein
MHLSKLKIELAQWILVGVPDVRCGGNATAHSRLIDFLAEIFAEDENRKIR